MDLSSAAGKNISRIKRRLDPLFVLIVVVPIIFSTLYYGLLANDTYTSESRFVVRSPQRQTATGFEAFLQGAGFSRSPDDTFTVHDYALSRDALLELENEYKLSHLFSVSNIDIINRFGGIDGDRSFEALFKYYGRRAEIVFDTQSSISTLRTNAFTAVDAYNINKKLLELSEKLINKLNERGRQDLLRYATAEVELAEKKATATTLAVSNFRTQREVFDPDRQSNIQMQLIAKLQDELIAVKSQLSEIKALARDNPQIATLTRRRDSLQKTIESETSKVAGATRSLSTKSAEFERLTLQRVFAEKQLAAALTSLEQARNEANRKQLYLERIVQPSLPDAAYEPRRLRNILATIILSLLVWGIAVMLLSGIREHQS